MMELSAGVIAYLKAEIIDGHARCKTSHDEYFLGRLELAWDLLSMSGDEDAKAFLEERAR